MERHLGESKNIPERPSSSSARQQHERFGRHLQPDIQIGASRNDSTSRSRSPVKRSGDEAELDVAPRPVQKKFRPGEEKYLKGLLERRPLFEQNQEKLGGETDFDGKNAEATYREFEPMLGSFKDESKYIVGKVFEENYPLPKPFIDNWQSAYARFKEFESIDKASTSTSEDWAHYLNEHIDRIRGLQSSVVPIADLALARARKDGKTDDIDVMLEQFTDRVKKSESGEQKEQRLQMYQQNLQEHEQSYQELKTHLGRMQETNTRGEKIHVSSFLDEFKGYREKIRAIGSLIEKECLPSGSEEQSRKLAFLKGAYEIASQDYNDFAREHQNLPAQEPLRQSLEMLSTSMEDFRAIHELYTELANTKAKGKGRAQIESPPDISMKEGSASPDQLARDRKLAEALQEQEYGLHSDVESDQPSSEGEHDQSSSEPDSVHEADMQLIKREYPKLTEDEKKLYGLYKRVEIMQMRLKTHLRSPYLSHEAIQEVCKTLVGYVTIIHKHYCSELGEGTKETEVLTDRKDFYKQHGLSSKNGIPQEETKKIFKTIKKDQNDLLKKVQALLEEGKPEGASKRKRFKKFVSQIELEQKNEVTFQKYNVESIKAEIQAKELAQNIIKKRSYGYEEMTYSTVAVAYMRNKNNEIIIATSVNEGSSYLQSFIEEEIRSNEKLIKVEKGKRHAEQVILDYAKEHHFTIEALGVSRPCCPNCWRAILNSKDIITPEAVSQEQPSQEKLAQGDTLHSDDVEDPYGIVPEAVSQEQPDQKKLAQGDASRSDDVEDPHDLTADKSEDQQIEKKHRQGDFPDWMTETDKSKIEKYLIKGIRDLLGNKYIHMKFDVNSMLSNINIFSNHKGVILGTNNNEHLSRELQNYGFSIHSQYLNRSWNKNQKRSDFSPTIPQEKDSITWHFRPLYILEKKEGQNIVVYDNLNNFIRDYKMTETDKKTLLKNKSLHGWNIIKELDKYEKIVDVQIIKAKQKDTAKPTYEEKTIEKGWNYFVCQNKEGKIVAKACVPKKSAGSNRSFLEYIGYDINLYTDIQINRKFDTLLRKQGIQQEINGWKEDRSILATEKESKRQKSEKRIIVWEYE